MFFCLSQAAGKSNKGKGKGKKVVKKDAFLKKEWYMVRAPNTFDQRDVGYVLANKTSGNRTARENLLGRVVEASLGDLKKDAEDDAFRKFKLKVEDVQGDKALANFHGMSITTDKIRSLVRRWQSLIEVYVDVKTTDGYVLRIFVIGFTARRRNQRRTTSYAKSSQIRALRQKMLEIIKAEAEVALDEFVKKLVAEVIGGLVETASRAIYPLQNVLVRKVKVLKAPKLDLGKLHELHGGADVVADLGKAIEVENAIAQE